MTEDDIKQIVRETVHETLRAFGLNDDDPFALQKDFQHLRSWRESTEMAKRHFLTVSLGFIVVAVLGWLGASIAGAFRG